MIATGTGSTLTDDTRPKGFTIGKYYFRRDGAGYECRLIVGTGKARKRPYLAYLSRKDFDQMSGDEEQLLNWAEQKKEEKWKG